jgi:hypothetical protein
MAMVSSFRPDSAAADVWADSLETLSPADPMVPLIVAARALAYFGEGDYTGALRLADEALDLTPGLQPPWRVRAASLEMLGDHVAAAHAVERMLLLGDITMERIREITTPLAEPGPWKTYLEALERAGVPA